MKKIYLLLIFAAVIFAACTSRNPHNQTVGELYSSNSFLANDEKLPQTVDLSLDISKLNYQELRILRYHLAFICAIYERLRRCFLGLERK